MKESRYVRLANTMLHVLRNARTPIIFLHRKSNHIHIHRLAAYGIIIGDDTPVRRKEELSPIFEMVS
ncbi:MAG: hypothetical protein JO297_04430 [Nitrososphaeraceae archaeon]|nr:hypothetical protein [Nitrososphaeraceae archaeon]